MVFSAHRRAEGGPPLSTPRELGYHMPAEWEPHLGTWLTWPRREGISFPGIFDRIPPVFATMVRALSVGEGVFINVCNEKMEAEARAVLAEHDALNERVEFFYHPSNEPWCRDHGPVFVKNKTGRAIVDWDYNAWGGKYPPYDLDNAIPSRIADARGLPSFTPGMVLEGGSIEVNGHGTLLTTERCLLNPNRNPDLSREQIEQRLRDFLGVEKIIWLRKGIAGGDTDGHIDEIARFVGEQTVVAATEENAAEENHAPLKENLERLQKESFEIIELPMPAPVFFEGDRLPASYANFYIGNEAVLVPAFGDANDQRAQSILAECFPTCEIVPIGSTDLAWGLGSFHCLTQQEPA